MTPPTSAQDENPIPDDPNLFVLSPFNEATYKHGFEPWTITPHAIYPPNGRWGILTTNDAYVVAGGSDSFISALVDGLGGSEEAMIAGWLDELAEAQRVAPDGGRKIADWAPAQLGHIVGAERADKALRSSRLRWPARRTDTT